MLSLDIIIVIVNVTQPLIGPLICILYKQHSIHYQRLHVHVHVMYMWSTIYDAYYQSLIAVLFCLIPYGALFFHLDIGRLQWDLRTLRRLHSLLITHLGLFEWIVIPFWLMECTGYIHEVDRADFSWYYVEQVSHVSGWYCGIWWDIQRCPDELTRTARKGCHYKLKVHHWKNVEEGLIGRKWK